MLENIEDTLERECGLVKDRPIIVGVSGGPDSLCLLGILRQAGYSLIVAYFDHKLRDDSTADALMVEKIAKGLMLPCVVDGTNVRAWADEHKLSIEEAGRTLRYRFMFDLARQKNAQAVAVGHTADDQVETILMHFLRGSGLNGLKGMSHRSIIKSFDVDIPIVRPLLDMWRDQTVVYCAINGLRPHYDSSNDSINFQRNRIRHLLIPSLESYNPKLREGILRMSQSLKGDHAFMLEMLEAAWNEVVTNMDEEMIAFDAVRLAASSLGLQRNLVKQAMQTLRPGVDISYTVLERASKVIHADSASARGDLKGGLSIILESGIIYICTSDAKLPFDLWPQLQDGIKLVIPVPGQVVLAGDWKMNCEIWRHPTLALEQAQRNDDPFQVWLDADQAPDSFELRMRLPGDHFAPLGMDGHSQKLSDFFVNEKIPLRARDHWPLLCSKTEVVWVPGHRPSHVHRLTDSTRRVIYFSLLRPSPKKADP